VHLVPSRDVRRGTSGTGNARCAIESCALEDPMRISPPHRLLGTADAHFRRRRLRDAFVQSIMINARPPALSRGGSRFYRFGAKASDGDSYGQAGLVENAYPSRAGS
jgi:hypothetical protein